MAQKTDIKNLLEIFLLTHSRRERLDNTLRQLRDSPFAKCPITVLDNHSVDGSLEISEKYIGQFPTYRKIYHPRDIGGDYNFLRAIELSTLQYTWILCDDDDYDFTDAPDVIEKIESCQYDLIFVSSRSNNPPLNWSGSGATTVRQLVTDGAHYHLACLFWPSLIFRSTQFDASCFHNVPNATPSIKFINKTIRENYSLYLPKNGIVLRYECSPMPFSPLYFYREWTSNFLTIDDGEIRRRVIDQLTNKGFIKTLFFWIAIEKASRRSGFWKMIIDIWFSLMPCHRIKYIMLLPVMIVPLPMSLLIRARELAYRLMGHKDVSKLPPLSI